MKKILIIMVVQLTAILATTRVVGQGAAKAHDSKPSDLFAFSTIEDLGTTTSVYPVVVSDRVNQNFLKEFANVSDAEWIQKDNGYIVWFTRNGILNRAFLTERGNCKSLIRYYTEEGLPAAVRHQVKSTYYDFSITRVTEVQHNNATVYLVTIADKTTWKVIRVQDGEMDTWEAHDKG